MIIFYDNNLAKQKQRFNKTVLIDKYAFHRGRVLNNRNNIIRIYCLYPNNYLPVCRHSSKMIKDDS